MTREEALEKARLVSVSKFGEYSNDHETFMAGFMAAYDMLITPKPTQRSWEIVGGDPRAAGHENKFHSMNKAHEALEFLQENCPGQPWELKEIN